MRAELSKQQENSVVVKKDRTASMYGRSAERTR